jgi:hypothetical protein
VSCTALVVIWVMHHTTNREMLLLVGFPLQCTHCSQWRKAYFSRINLRPWRRKHGCRACGHWLALRDAMPLIARTTSTQLVPQHPILHRQLQRLSQRIVFRTQGAERFIVVLLWLSWMIWRGGGEAARALGSVAVLYLL